MFYNLQKKTAGFTLIEMLVYVSLAILLAVMGAEFVVGGLRSTTFAFEQDEAVQNARRVIDSFIREVRDAQSSERGDYLLLTVDEQELAFYCDTDSDGSVDLVRYFLDGSQLKKSITPATGTPIDYYPANAATVPVADYVNNQSEPIFTYYDTNNALIASTTGNIDDIRMIHMSLKINVDPSRAPQDYYVLTDVQIRNLKDNL